MIVKLEKGEEVWVKIPGLNKLEDKMEEILEDAETNPRDMIDIVLGELADAGLTVVDANLILEGEKLERKG